MEIFELRYFFEVAKTENIHRASEKLRVSPASLSKAVARIEAELSAKLFSREGRNIRLNEQGNYLKTKAAEILRLEESVRTEIAGRHSRLHAILAGPEVLLSQFGMEMVDRIQKRHPHSSVEYQACTDEFAVEKVRRGEAHLAIVSGEVPRDLSAKLLGQAKFKTVVGNPHPLNAKARAGQAVPVQELLQYGFVSPSHAWLGQVGAHQSSDGWRDDQFPRKITHQSSSLKLLETLVTQGKAVAYLPDYLAKDLGLTVLKVTGCPYSCAQSIHLIALRPKDVGWINQLF